LTECTNGNTNCHGFDWRYENEVRVLAHLEELDEDTGLYFGEFNEHLVLREVITGPLYVTKRREIEAALQDEDATIAKSRLAFRTFKVVADRRGLP
jgi:hypothetical protein